MEKVRAIADKRWASPLVGGAEPPREGAESTSASPAVPDALGSWGAWAPAAQQRG